jgi:hypothetical protein
VTRIEPTTCGFPTTHHPQLLIRFSSPMRQPFSFVNRGAMTTVLEGTAMCNSYGE